MDGQHMDTFLRFLFWLSDLVLVFGGGGRRCFGARASAGGKDCDGLASERRRFGRRCEGTV